MPAVTLVELGAAAGDAFKEGRRLAIDELHVSREKAAGGGMAAGCAWADGHYLRVANLPGCLLRLPLRVEQVLCADEDDRLGFDRLQRLRRVAIESRRGA